MISLSLSLSLISLLSLNQPTSLQFSASSPADWCWSCAHWANWYNGHPIGMQFMHIIAWNCLIKSFEKFRFFPFFNSFSQRKFSRLWKVYISIFFFFWSTVWTDGVNVLLTVEENNLFGILLFFFLPLILYTSSQTSYQCTKLLFSFFLFLFFLSHWFTLKGIHLYSGLFSWVLSSDSYIKIITKKILMIKTKKNKNESE